MFVEDAGMAQIVAAASYLEVSSYNEAVDASIIVTAPVKPVDTYVVVPVSVTETNAPDKDLGVISIFILRGGLYVAVVETIYDALTSFSPYLNEVPSSVTPVVGEGSASPEFGDEIA